MPHRPQRYDAYGVPITPLTDARQESLVDTATNRHQRQVLRTLLEEALDEALLPLLHRGRYAELTLQCAIRDGTIVTEIRVNVSRSYRDPKEE